MALFDYEHWTPANDASSLLEHAKLGTFQRDQFTTHYHVFQWITSLVVNSMIPARYDNGWVDDLPPHVPNLKPMMATLSPELVRKTHLSRLSSSTMLSTTTRVVRMVRRQ
ncbi:hypothetical protein Salat_0838700 [Sesamum alatum]|uniref:Uncharacterized protein n=1 Tax=Sesamum alatum TaxID=300844 RepID=A0AAE1YI85_9LAMI|nr:hypothetical protein Salat_0838700 [Sesamum alatum]